MQRRFRVLCRVVCFCALFALVGVMLSLGSVTPVSAGTAAALATKTKAPIDTSEAIDDDSFPLEIDPTGGNPKLIMKRLQDDEVVPKGGKQVIQIPDSFGTTSDPNFSYLRLGRGTQAQDMVFQFEMGWTRAGKGSGCGMVFRAVDNKLDNFWTFMITEDLKVVLTHTEEEENVVDLSVDTEDFLKDKYNFVTLIVLDDKVAAYLNGRLQAVKITTGTIDKGVFAITVYNDEFTTKKVSTYCAYQKIWVWSLD